MSSSVLKDKNKSNMNDQQKVTPNKDFINFFNSERQEDLNYTISKGVYTHMIEYLLENHNDKEHHINYFWDRSWGNKALIYMYHYCKTYGNIEDEMCWKIWRGEMNELNPSYETVVSAYLNL